MTLSELAYVLGSLEQASGPEAVFQVDADTSPEEQRRQLKRSFRRLASVVHPDHNQDTDATRAADAFAKLEGLRSAALEAIEAGRYGRQPVRSFRLDTREGRFQVRALLADGDIAGVYLAERDGSSFAVKLGRDPADNDLLAAEAEALKLLNSSDAVESRLRPYVPELAAAFSFRHDGTVRRAVATPLLEGFYTLREVRQAYPDGLDWRDMAWMFRRLLVVAGFAHANGLVHAAVLPENVLIEPAAHGLVLIDWAYHVADGGVAGAISGSYRDWYPPEVRAREPLHAQTDIFMAARCAQFLLGANASGGSVRAETPDRLRGFLESCTESAQRSRPDDAWELLQEFDELIGPRSFRPFLMPTAGIASPRSGGTPAAPTSTDGRS